MRTFLGSEVFKNHQFISQYFQIFFIGFISTQIGATIHFIISVDLLKIYFNGGVVHVSLMKSYNDMGMVKFTFSRGHVTKDFIVDTLWNVKVSQIDIVEFQLATAFLNADLNEESLRVDIEIMKSQVSRSENKVKLLSMLLM